MIKKGILFFIASCLTLSLIGCGNGAKPVYTIKQAEREGAENKPVEENDPEMMSMGVNQFAFNMYDHLNGDGNMIFSPYSLCCALSLLDQAAGGSTKKELEEMLGIKDLDEWNQQIRNYLSKEWTKETYVLTANSVWMDQNKAWSDNIKNDFLIPAGYYYQSELFKEDFKGNADEVVQLVNGWVNSNTKGMIPKILEKLSPDTVMLLMNAVYFQGKWETPFEVDNTTMETFHGLLEDTNTEMMQQYGEYYAYYNDGTFQGISLPYKETGIVMNILMPVEEDEKIGELFSSMSLRERKDLMDSLKGAEQKKISLLALPKFTMEQQIEDLDSILMDMGMESAYSESADLNGIAEDLYVSQVLHKAKIVVDEEGTKAAAVTVIATCETSCMEEEEINFVVNKPFMYVLQDTETGMILFMGQMNDVEN